MATAAGANGARSYAGPSWKKSCCARTNPDAASTTSDTTRCRRAELEIQPEECAKLERLCRYVRRSPVATERLALTPSGQVRYPLKIPYRDGTTHIVLEAPDLMAGTEPLRSVRTCCVPVSRAFESTIRQR